MINSKVAGKYTLLQKIGAGTFGEIYLSSSSKGEEFAVKIERLSSRSPQLIYESKVLSQIQGGAGIPSLKWAGIEGNYTMMILELLGPNIEDLFNMCKRKFSLKTVLMTTDQLLTRIEYIHSKSFLHRDIKPENFLIGLGPKASLIYIIDFGLSKKFRDPKSLKHIEYKEGKYLTGTARYASINTHAGIEPSRRDDLQSIAYVLLYLMKGNLPWQGMNASSRLEKYRFIMDKKVAVSDEELCFGLPDEFKELLQYAKQLAFDDTPDYQYLRNRFRGLMVRNEWNMDLAYDWISFTSPHKKVKSCLPEEKKVSLNERERKRNKSHQIYFDKKSKKNCIVF